MAIMLENVSNRAILWINIVLKLLDVSLTTYIVTTWGITAESNPLIRNTIEGYGLIPTMIGITLAYIAFVWFLYRKNKRKLALVVTALMSLLVIVNIFATVIQ